MLHLAVRLKPDLAEQVQTEQGEYHNPDCEINLPVQKTPMISLVRHAEELQTESNLDESEHNLHGVQPAAALELLQQRREHRENREWQCEGHREGKHCHHRSPELALSGFDQDRTHDRTGAGE